MFLSKAQKHDFLIKLIIRYGIFNDLNLSQIIFNPDIIGIQLYFISQRFEKLNTNNMENIDFSNETSNKGPGVKKAKKLSTRIDMTPMVDLGFLLITFFIFTATMSTPSTMSLNMPKKSRDADSMQIKASNALTLMIGKETIENKPVYYYMGQLERDGSNFKSATFDQIRKIIIDKRKEVMEHYTNHTDTTCEKILQQAKTDGDPNWENACRDKEFVVVIKSTKYARYASLINLLDEMTINGVKSFALEDIIPRENELIEKSEKTRLFKTDSF